MVDMGKDLSTASYKNWQDGDLRNNPVAFINDMSNRLWQLKHAMDVLDNGMLEYENRHRDLTSDMDNLQLPEDVYPSVPEHHEDLTEYDRHIPKRNDWNESDIKPNLPVYVNYLSDIIHELEFACNLLQQRQAGYVHFCTHINF